MKGKRFLSSSKSASSEDEPAIEIERLKQKGVVFHYDREDSRRKREQRLAKRKHPFVKRNFLISMGIALVSCFVVYYFVVYGTAEPKAWMADNNSIVLIVQRAPFYTDNTDASDKTWLQLTIGAKGAKGTKGANGTKGAKGTKKIKDTEGANHFKAEAITLTNMRLHLSLLNTVPVYSKQERQDGNPKKAWWHLFTMRFFTKPTSTKNVTNVIISLQEFVFNDGKTIDTQNYFYTRFAFPSFAFTNATSLNVQTEAISGDLPAELTIDATLPLKTFSLFPF